MTATDEYLERNRAYARTFAGPLPMPPSRHLAVVACMDARLDVYGLLGLGPGEAHVIRNAGGVVTDDIVRSLAISQRKLETREVIVMQHTSCGLSMITEDEFKDELEQDTKLRPPWAIEAFREVKDSVRQSVERVRRSPFIPHRRDVRGFVYDVHTAELTEVF